MKFLVSGGAGFIGSHLAERLLLEGNEVIVLDNLITGDLNNLEPLKKHGDRFRFIDHDITSSQSEDGRALINARLTREHAIGERAQPLKLADALEGPLDVVCNLACPSSPVDYQNIPLETLWVSAMGTKNMLDVARAKRALFFHTSTSEVYGDPLEHPQTESYFGNVNCLGPRSCYDEGKRFAESLIVNYGKRYGVSTKMVRIFNTYGPRMRGNDGRVIPNFISQALEGKPITIFGDGYQTRSFCYIDDMVEGIVSMLRCENFSGPVNLGNPEECSIKYLAELVVELTHSSSEIINHPLPQDDPKVRRPDISLAREKLGFNPKVGLEGGLQKTIEWFRATA